MALLDLLGLCLVGFALTQMTYAIGFRDRAASMVNSFDEKFKTKTTKCADKGTAKANNLGLDATNDQYYAVALVNIYTQDCLLNSGPQFFEQLNAKITESQFKEYAELLSEAIDILKPGKSDEVLYRCQREIEITVDNIYKPNRFTSTSKSMDVACGFSGGMLFVIKNGQGLHVENYSYYPREYEVLIDYKAEFNVKNVNKKIDGSDAILQELQRYNNNQEVPNADEIKTLVILEQRSLRTNLAVCIVGPSNLIIALLIVTTNFIM